MLQVGIVGLANVGKSTLFNALMRRQQAMVANYPFATIEPNVGIVPVPDGRLTKLREIVAVSEKVNPPPIVPATVRFVDIAGLVKGASQGAGLGNKFLSHIREVDLIAQVVRAFPDEEVIREGSSEPKSDIETINTELILADLETLTRAKEAKGNRGDQGNKGMAMQKLTEGLNAGKLASEVDLTDEEKEAAKEFQLLTMKRMIYVLNVNTASQFKEIVEVAEEYRRLKKRVCVIDAKLEAELAVLSPDEQAEYLESLGIKDAGVDQLINLAYETLNLISFLTAGEKEVRAWPIPKGTKAPQAAGTIHTDFEKGFIKAEVVDFEAFIDYNGWQGARENGKVRFEGKDYEMKDGEVVEFKVNA